MGNAIRVGVFVGLFLCLLVGAYAVLGRSIFAPPAQHYSATFEDATGVTIGTPVLMAGVRVGHVDLIELAGPNEAKLRLALNPQVKVPVGTVAEVPTSLIGFGDNPIQLKAPARAESFLSPGDAMAGRKAGALEGILPDTSETLAELNATLKEVRLLIADPALKKDVQKLTASTADTVEAFGALARRMDGVMAKNDRSIQLALARGASAVADVQRITAAVARLIEDGTLQKDAGAILKQLGETSKKADQLVANMNRLVSNPALDASLGNVAEISASGKSIAENLDDISYTGKSIAANADKIAANGVRISENVVDLTERSKKVIDGAAEIEGKVKDLIDRVEGVISPGGGPKLPPLTTSMDLLRETEPGRYRTDFTARLQLDPDNHLDIGVFDAFERNRLTLQYGTKADPRLTYRYGVFAGKPGVGVDYQLTPKLFLRNDVWDLNNPRYDARLRAEFGGGLYGWVGSERIFSKNSPVFGIGVRR